MKGVRMWGTNCNNNNSFIWLILLILIFFTDGSSTPISGANYFRLTNNVTNTNNLLNGFFN